MMMCSCNERERDHTVDREGIEKRERERRKDTAVIAIVNKINNQTNKGLCVGLACFDIGLSAASNPNNPKEGKII